jgi:hypothetical protein
MVIAPAAAVLFTFPWNHWLIWLAELCADSAASADVTAKPVGERERMRNFTAPEMPERTATGGAAYAAAVGVARAADLGALACIGR